MRTKYRHYLIILLFSYILFSISAIYPENIVSASPDDMTIERAIQVADQKQKQSQDKALMINQSYNKGKAYYNSRRYGEAKACFEQILDIQPGYEPAELFLESVALQEGIIEARGRIEGLKLEMANIMAEYDKRVKRTDSLAVKYFLEQAQNQCQLGNFKEAERLYDLCYKVYPYSKNKIEWFVKATHDLMELYSKLDEESRNMDELIKSLH